MNKRRKQWTNVYPTLIQRLLSAGVVSVVSSLRLFYDGGAQTLRVRGGRQFTAGRHPSCRIRSDRQTTSLTLTTGVCEAGTKMRGVSNMNRPIHYDVTVLFTDCSVEVTLRSDCLGRLNQLHIFIIFVLLIHQLLVRLDIETKFPHFLFLTWLSIIKNQRSRL